MSSCVKYASAASAFIGACILCLSTFSRAQGRALDEGDESRDATEEAPTDLELSEGEVIIIDAAAPARSTWSPSGRTVTQEALALTPHRSVDDLLRVVPGLHIAQHAAEGKAQQFFLRGFDAVHGSDIAIVVGGVPINEASNVHGHGYVDLGFVTPELVRSLSATKGSFEVSQGDFATAGSIDIDLGVDGPRRGQRMSYEVGSTQRHRVLALFAPKDLPDATFVAVEGMSDEGFGEHRSSHRINALAQHRFELARDRWWQVLGGAYGARFDEAGVVPLADYRSGAIDFYDTYNPEGDGASLRALASARFHDESDAHRLDSTTYLSWRKLRLAENFTGYLVHPEMGDLRSQQHVATTAGTRLAFERQLAGGLTLVSNAEARAEQIAQSEDQIDESGMPWQRNRDVSATLASGGAGVALRVALGRRLQAELGGRVDAVWIRAKDELLDQEGTELFVNLSPRMSTFYALSPGWKIFAGYGHGIRSPEARSVAAMAGASSDTHFTTSRTGEMGGEGWLGETLKMGVTGFGTWISNELVFDHLSGINLARNATRRVGAEARLELAATPWLQLRGDATAVSARFVDSGSPVPGAPQFLARGEAQAMHPSGFRGGAQLTVMAPRSLAHGAEGAGFAVVDLIGSYRFGAFDLGVQVDNLFNSKWREGEFHFASHHDRDAPPSLIPRLHYAAGRPFGIRASITAWF